MRGLALWLWAASVSDCFRRRHGPSRVWQTPRIGAGVFHAAWADESEQSDVLGNQPQEAAETYSWRSCAAAG